MKIGMVCLPNLENFVKPIAESLNANLYVGTEKSELTKVLQESDIIWIEWANEMAVHLTNDPEFVPLLSGKKVIVRCHSYEALSGYISAIDWSKVTDVIFVAEHVRGLVADQWASFPDNKRGAHENLNTWVIPNGIDLEKFPYVERKKGWDIGMLANISHKKGPMLLLQSFDLLCKSSKKYKLHIGGASQDMRYMLYYRYILPRMHLQDNVLFAGHISDVPKFFENINYIICTSPWEGCPVGLLEGMALGLKPLIHNFVGAENQFPKEWIWNTPAQLRNMIKSKHYDSSIYRRFVESRHSFVTMINSIKEITGESGKASVVSEQPPPKSPPVDVSYTPSTPDSPTIDPDEDIDPVVADLENLYEKTSGAVDMVSRRSDKIAKKPVNLSDAKANPVKLDLHDLPKPNIDKKFCIEKALAWIDDNTIDMNHVKGISLTNTRDVLYPEVTGYFIPTLLRFNREGLALDFAKALIRIQQRDGSFTDIKGESFAFDTAQAMRGFIAIIDARMQCPGIYDALNNAAKWICNTSNDKLQIKVPSGSAWDMGNRGRVPEAIHLYCLEPLIRASEILDSPYILKFAKQSFEYYMKNVYPECLDFSQPNMLSHFFCYIMEALIDIRGMETFDHELREVLREDPDPVFESMKQLQKEKMYGFIPAYDNENWICTPGMAQASLVLAKLGEIEKATELFENLCQLQSANGGFYGSFGSPHANYFPREQPSWAIKYFLDAYAKIMTIEEPDKVIEAAKPEK